jgi:transposase
MEQYVALDVSLKEVSVCIIDSKGAVVFEGKTATQPATLVALIRRNAPQVVRVGLETGSTSPWLFHVLTSAGLPVVCMDARHAHAAMGRATDPGENRDPGNDDQHLARVLTQAPRLENSHGRIRPLDKINARDWTRW